MALSTNDEAAFSLHFFNSNQDISGTIALGISEGEYIFQQFALVIFGRILKAILFSLEINRMAFFHVEKVVQYYGIERCSISSHILTLPLPAHAVFDIVVNDEVQFLICQAVVVGQHAVDFVDDVL